MRVLVAVPLLLAAACSSVDRKSMTSFEPHAGGTFTFVAAANSIEYPVESERAEAIRKGWLEQYLRDNNLCHNGYEITERNAVLVDRAMLGSGHRIFYRGRCKG